MTDTQRDLFDGATFEPARDGERLARQMADVTACMTDGRWHTLAEIAEATGHPEASVSARIRDLRKSRWGNRTVQRRFDSPSSLWRYRLVPI